jgi:hypothetical protein
MESADSYILSKIRWQIFGGLSYKTPNCPEDRRLKRFFGLMRSTVKDFHIYFPNVPWCLRLERGPIGGALHNHFLLAGLPDDALCTATCTTMMQRWQEKFGGAESKIQLFDPSLGGVDYVTKCLGYDAVLGAQSFKTSDQNLRYAHAVWDEANHFRKSVNC